MTGGPPEPGTAPSGTAARRRSVAPRAVLAGLLACALALASPLLDTGARAEPTRADLDAAEQRLFELGEEFSLAVEAYNRARDEHAAVSAEIATLEAEVVALQAAVDRQAGDVARVVRSLYQGSAVRGIGTLLESTEASDLQRRAGYLRSAQRSQHGVLERFSADRRVLQGEVAELEAAEARAAALDAQLAEQAEGIEARLAAQQAEVAELTATIERLERERAEREAAERAAREAAEQAAREAAAEASAPPREVAGRAERSQREEQAPAPASEQPEPTEPEDPQPEPTEPEDPQHEPEASEPEPEGSAPEDPQPEPTEPEDPEPEPSTAAASGAAGAALEAARSRLGLPYRWGASGPDAFDCSGLTSWAWAQAGVSMPRSSGAQYAALPKVDRADLRPGDLVFFGSPIHHVGIYAGGGRMIEAPYTGQVVRYRSIDRRDYVGAARPGG